MALKHRDFHFVIAGEEQSFPLVLGAFFERQLELRVLGADELRKFVEGREFLVLGQDPGVVAHGFPPQVPV
jgi:hypothetical protein